MSKATFIRSIGNCYVNYVGFDLYENKDGSATIRPTAPGGHTFPASKFKKFDSLDGAEAFIDQVSGEDSEGAERVSKLREYWSELLV